MRASRTRRSGRSPATASRGCRRFIRTPLPRLFPPDSRRATLSIDRQAELPHRRIHKMNHAGSGNSKLMRPGFAHRLAGQASFCRYCRMTVHAGSGTDRMNNDSETGGLFTSPISARQRHLSKLRRVRWGRSSSRNIDAVDMDDAGDAARCRN